MTRYVQLTRMAPDAVADQARELCVAMAGESSAGGELSVALVPEDDPTSTPTWYMTSGPIDEEFAKAMKDPQVMFERCKALGMNVPLEMCQGLLSICIIDDRQGIEVMREMGLAMWVDPNSLLFEDNKP